MRPRISIDMYSGAYLVVFLDRCAVLTYQVSFSGGIVAELGYGHRIESFDDEFFEIGEGYAKLSLAGGTPSLLDLNPICESRPLS